MLVPWLMGENAGSTKSSWFFQVPLRKHLYFSSFLPGKLMAGCSCPIIMVFLVSRSILSPWVMVMSSML